MLLLQGGDTGVGDSRANRYCGSNFDSSEGASSNGQVTGQYTIGTVVATSIAVRELAVTVRLYVYRNIICDTFIVRSLFLYSYWHCFRIRF